MGERMTSSSAAVASKRRLPASGQTQVVFVQLDPILKKLLEYVTKYRELTEQLLVVGSSSNSNNRINMNEPSSILERWIANVKSQVDCLHELQEAIQVTLGPPFAPSLLVLADYISLPLTAIFHILSQQEVTTNTTNNNTVLVSYLRKLHQAAAECIQIYTQVVTPPDTVENLPIAISLSSKHSIQFLVALTRGIPTANINVNATSTSPQDNDGHDKATKALDDGSDCWMAILHALRSVLKVCPTKDLVQALEGGLVARLVDCATTIVEGGKTSSMISSKDTVRLESVQLLQNLLDQTADDPNIWQSLFPGVLVALYRCLLSCHRQASTGQSVAVECGCLQCIQKLLRITLVPIQNKEQQLHHQGSSSAASSSKEVDGTSTATTMLQNLQLLARNTNEKRTPRPPSSSSSPPGLVDSSKTDFLSHVRERAVTPLHILLKQAMASKSSSVCLEATHLCQVVLVETNTCWRGTSLPEAAMECCLILQNTAGDDRVAQSAKSVLNAQQQQLGTKDLAPIISKIRSLVGELPVLSQGGKTVDLKMHLQLLKGYVQALGPKAGKELAASTFPYQPLIQLMEVDFSAATQVSRLLPLLEVTVWDSSMSRDHHSKLPCRYLTLDNARLAEEVIESFGKALGAKQGAFVVDALLSDMFEGWALAPPTLALLKKWAGSLSVATKVFIGAFHPYSSSEDLLPLSQKEEKRRRKILLSLASSILPLLAHPPIYLLSSAGQTDQLGSNEFDPTPKMQQGIASVLVLLLELQAVMTNLLQRATEDFVSILLYPTIDKVHAKNSVIVQGAAMDALRSIAYACGVDQVSCLLQREAARLLVDMLSRLRVPGGATISRGEHATETLAVAFCLTWVCEEIVRGGTRESPFLVDGSTVSGVVELGNTLMDRLDLFFVNKVIAEQDTFKITEMYSAFFRYLIFLFDRDDNVEQGQEEENVGGGSWLELLSVFHLPCKEAFGEEEEEDSEGSRHETCSDLTGGLTISKAEIDLSSKIISMACYFLSNESLRVQISACESLAWGFQFLALTAKKDPEKVEAEIRNAVFRQVATSWPSIKARLSNVTDQVIENKRAITSLLVVSPSHQAGTPQRSNRDIPTQRFFLSRMFQLVASMFECSGDFMADRFNSSVWPIIAKQFAFLMESQEKKHRSRPGQKILEEVSSSIQGHNIVSTSKIDDSARHLHQWSDSERHLLLSMTRCLSRILGCEDSRGTCIVRIHQAIGLVLLPFLGDPDDEISSGAMAAIKNLVAQDCDVLLRPMLETSGRGIIRPIWVSQLQVSHRVYETDQANNPICVVTSTNKRAREHETITAVEKSKSKLAMGCEEILTFIDKLPEQELH